MKKQIFKRLLIITLSISVLVTSLPLYATIQAASARTITEEFNDLTMWEDMVANFKQNTSPAKVDDSSVVTTDDGKTAMLPVHAKDGRNAYITTVKDEYWSSDRRLESFSTSFFINATSGSIDNDTGIYLYRPMNDVNGVSVGNYQGLAVQTRINNGKLQWRWEEFKYDATQKTECNHIATKNIDTSIDATKWITLSVEYDYSAISQNKLTVNVTFSDGATTSKGSKTLEFVSAPDSYEGLTDAEIKDMKVYQDGFKVGIGSTADKSGNRVSTYYFDNFSAEFAETSDEKVANFETKYQEILSISSITNNQQANMMFNALAEFNSLSDTEKAQLIDVKNKLQTLKTSWYITEDDFESEALLNEVWESLPETGDIQTVNSKNEIVTTTLVSNADIVKESDNSVLVPEYRSISRKRKILTVKQEYLKADSEIESFSTDLRVDARNSFDNNSGIYIYYKDQYNWARLEVQSTEGKEYMRFSYQSGDDITSLTQKIVPNNIKLANFALNKWFTVKADYSYSSAGMTVKVSIIDTDTQQVLNTFTHETNIMNSGVRVGYAAAVRGTEVYYDNFSVKYKVREDELDIDEVNKFLTDYKDVFGFTGKLTDSQKQRLDEACATFFSLKKLTKEYLTEQGKTDKLISLASSYKDEAVDIFKADHKEILSKTTDNITREDKLKLYAALKVYNGFNSLQKMSVYKQGTLLRALDVPVVERTGEYDCSPFYEDFESGLNKWKLDFTNSNQYVFETTTDSDNPSNTLLKSSGYSMFFIPTDKYWPAKGKMVKLSLRMKFDGFIPHNPPMVVYSYKDENNYYSASVKNDGYKSENLGFSGGIPVRSYELNKGEKLLDMSDWVNVEISLEGKKATLVFTDHKGTIFSMNFNYYEAGRIAIGFDDNNGRTTKHYSKTLLLDDIYAEFVKGDWDNDDIITSIVTYNTGNVWMSGGDIVTISGEELGSTVASAKIMRLPDDADYRANYGFVAESTFENNGKNYVVLGKNVDWDFSSADKIEKFQHVAEDSLQLIIPKTYTDGIYALMLEPKYENEEPVVVLLNRPRISAVMGDDGATSYAGGSISIIGENLSPESYLNGNEDASDITVVLQNLETKENIFIDNSAKENIVVYKNDNYKLKVSLPEKLADGKYAVMVHNGYGTSYAWSAPGEITITKSVRDSWSKKEFNVLDYGAVGDGEENDTPAVINALQAAADNGGGVVYFPSSGKNSDGIATEGMYRVIDTLFIPENVVVKGDGAENSMIIWTATKWQYNKLPDTLLAVTNNVEIKDISIRGTRAYNYIKTYKKNVVTYDYSENQNIYVTNVNAYFWRRAGVPTQGGHSGWSTGEMTGQEIELVLLTETKGSLGLAIDAANVQLDGYILNTDKQLNQSACRNAYMHTEYLQVRNSELMKGTFHGSNSNAAIIEDCSFGPDGPQFMGLSHAYVARNHYHDQTQNNHELLLNDGTPRIRQGTIQYVNDTTYRLIQDKPLKDDLYNGYALTVVQGQGTGQVRTIVDTYNVKGENYTYFTVNAPFKIAPNRNSQVFVQQPRASRTIVNCLLEDGGVVGTYGTDINGIYDRNTIQGTAMGFGFDVYYGVIWYDSIVNNVITAANYTHGETVGSDGNVAAKSTPTFYEFQTRADCTTPCRAYLFRDNQMPNGAYFFFGGTQVRSMENIVLQENMIAKAEYAIVGPNNNPYNYFDGLTLYNNDFEGCIYDYDSKGLNDLSNELNINSMKDYNQAIIDEDGNSIDAAPGDVNLDGKVTLKDVTYIRYYLLKKLELTGKNKEMADYDADGQVTLRDALLIRESL